jgi:AraC-like DNA-binding protein
MSHSAQIIALNFPESRAMLTKPRDENAADRELLETVANSALFKEFAMAFTTTTGLPLAIRTVESWHLPHHNKTNEGPFCAIIAQTSRACAACLDVQEKLSKSAAEAPATATCQLGLNDTAVPLRLGNRLLGFLQTGQMIVGKPSETKFKEAVKKLASWGIVLEQETLREAYFASKTVNPQRHTAIIQLLRIFAEQLSMLTNQIMVHRDTSEPPIIARAKEFIDAHLTEDFRLKDVAEAVHTSQFYFCKLFKAGTGINFSAYVSRLRIEHAKNLLLNPNLRVSEIAFASGFQSLTHFNRVFLKIFGQSPSQYRAKLMGKNEVKPKRRAKPSLRARAMAG